MTAGPNLSGGDETLSVQIPLRLRKRGGRKLMVAPEGATAWAPPRARVDSAMVKAICDDGIVVVSCDDNEVHNLRCLMNEVFGEENFVTQIIWKKSYGGGSKTKHVVVLHEYVLCFARNKDSLGRLELPPDPEARRYYKLKDAKFETRGPYRLQPLATTSNDERENLRYPIPYQDEEIWPEKQWQWEKTRTMAALANDELAIAKTKGEWSINYKQYLYDEDGVERGAKPYSVQEGPYTQTGTAEVKDLLGGSKIFPFPKPSELVRHFIQYAHPDKDFIAMDFFAGAASTAHAVLSQNAADGGTRKFVCVQLPELCEAGTEAAAAGFKTIADISRTRIRKVIDNIKASGDLATQAPANLGFKSFLLTPSNFKQWRGDAIEDETTLAAQIEMFVKAEKDGTAPGNILYELLLKFGQPLATVEKIEIAGEPVYGINNRALLFVLERFTLEMIEPLLALKPQEIVALDSVFHDSDKLKSNLDLQCRDADVRFNCI